MGIVGPPGSGKSTLARLIADDLGHQGAAVLAMDAFHLSDQILSDLGRIDRKGAPDTFDVAGYVSTLERLRSPGREIIYAPEFDRGRELSVAAAIAIAPRVPLVITEGNYLLLPEGGWQAVGPLLDAVWYLDVPAGVLRSRLVSRRISHGEAPAAAEAWVDTVDLPNARIVESTRAAADAVIR